MKPSLLLVADDHALPNVNKFLKFHESFLGDFFDINLIYCGNEAINNFNFIRNVVYARKFSSYSAILDSADKFGHPVGKYGKLLFIYEFLRSASDYHDNHKFIYSDPDVVINQIHRFSAVMDSSPDRVIFGKELVALHSCGSEKNRFGPLERQDYNIIARDTHLHEINTGFFGGSKGAIQKLFGEMDKWVTEFQLRYSDQSLRALNWHDQDCFRAFVRSVDCTSLGCVDYDHVFTANSYASHFLVSLFGEVRFLSGKKPDVIHYAGGSRYKVRSALLPPIIYWALSKLTK